jgi:hypothetical protein
MPLCSATRARLFRDDSRRDQRDLKLADADGPDGADPSSGFGAHHSCATPASRRSPAHDDRSCDVPNARWAAGALPTRSEQPYGALAAGVMYLERAMGRLAAELGKDPSRSAAELHHDGFPTRRNDHIQRPLSRRSTRRWRNRLRGYRDIEKRRAEGGSPGSASRATW